MNLRSRGDVEATVKSSSSPAKKQVKKSAPTKKVVDTTKEKKSNSKSAKTTSHTDEIKIKNETKETQHVSKKKPLKKQAELKPKEETKPETLSVEDHIEAMLQMESTARSSSKNDDDYMDDMVMSESEEAIDDEDDSEKEYKPSKKDLITSSSDDDDDDQFQEVEMASEQYHNMSRIKKAGSIQVTVEAKKTTKKALDRQAQLERLRRMQEKRHRVLVHKVHLISWLAHGFYLSRVCQSRTIQALTLSIQPELIVNSKGNQRDSLLKFVRHFNETLTLDVSSESNNNSMLSVYSTRKAIEKRVADSYLQYLIVLVVALRNARVRTRLCVCFEVTSLLEAKKRASKTNKNGKLKAQISKAKASKKTESVTTEDDYEDDHDDHKDEDEVKSKSSRNRKVSKKPKKSTRVSLSKKLKQKTEKADDESEDDATGSDDDDDDHDSFDKDYKEIVSNKRKSNGVEPIHRNKATSKNFKMLSDDASTSDLPDEKNEETNDNAEKKTSDRFYWIEVYLEDKKIWMSIEPIGLKTSCESYLEQRFDDQILYVCAFDEDKRFKDVTRKYAHDWLTAGRLAHITHVDEKKLWWESILLKYQPKDQALDMHEEKQIKEMLLAQPLPMSISEFKDHPLYVLKRHLLKFQSIYPAKVLPVAYLKDEAIYSRDNLVTLHSRQTWLKFARVIKPAQDAYKIVKGRLKHSEYKMGRRDNPDLELYGYWQTQPYDPPRAYGGKVPRNEFGNVELFLPNMLPRGCVHLRLPNLNRICRKIGIDCAAAVTGFDAHGGFSHAVYDGFVVCVEHKETVLDAYAEEERLANIKQVQAYQDRVYGNWKRIIKSVLIREKLKNKYETFNMKAHLKEKSTKATGGKQDKAEVKKEDEEIMSDGDEHTSFQQADERLKAIATNSAKETSIDNRHDLNEMHLQVEMKVEPKKMSAAIKRKSSTTNGRDKKETKTTKTTTVTKSETRREMPKRQAKNKKPVLDAADVEDETQEDDETIEPDDAYAPSDDEVPVKKSKRTLASSSKQVSKQKSESNLKNIRKRFEFPGIDDDDDDDSTSKGSFKSNPNALADHHDDLNLSEED